MFERTSDEERAQERWVAIPGYEGWYEVSDHGRVRSLTRTIESRRGPMTYIGVELILSRNSTGRLGVTLLRLNERKHRRIHELVLTAFVGPRPDGMEVCHNNGNADDNRLSNLRWGTHSENMYDKVRHGTDHNSAKMQCDRGHRLGPPNVAPSAEDGGGRPCWACRRARSRVYNHLVRYGQVLDIQEESDRQYEAILRGAQAKRRRRAA